MSKRLILFVCTGNVCRSPTAEYMLKDKLGPDSGWKICSAGFSADYGLPASQTAIEVLKERSIDLGPHRSRPVDGELVDAVSMIVVMTDSHLAQMRALFPDAMEKVFLLKSFDSAAGGGNIDDPIGLSVDVYYRIRDEIDAALPGLIEFMKTLE